MVTTTYRVHDAADDLIDDLIDNAQAALDGLDAQLERITASRTAIVAFMQSMRRTTATEQPAPPKLAAVQYTPDAVVEYVECKDCGQLVKTKGLAIHVARKHKINSISVAKFDPQVARDNAAAAL